MLMLASQILAPGLGMQLCMSAQNVIGGFKKRKNPFKALARDESKMLLAVSLHHAVYWCKNQVFYFHRIDKIAWKFGLSVD